jgi:hypothetical protein
MQTIIGAALLLIAGSASALAQVEFAYTPLNLESAGTPVARTWRITAAGGAAATAMSSCK